MQPSSCHYSDIFYVLCVAYEKGADRCVIDTYIDLLFDDLPFLPEHDKIHHVYSILCMFSCEEQRVIKAIAEGYLGYNDTLSWVRMA